MLRTKYRIKKKGNYYYPQEKFFFWWEGMPEANFPEDVDARFDDLTEAILFIRRRAGEDVEFSIV